MLEFLFNKVTGLKVCSFINQRLQHRCFHVNIAKFLRTAFFIKQLRWLLLNRVKTNVKSTWFILLPDFQVSGKLPPRKTAPRPGSGFGLGLALEFGLKGGGGIFLGGNFPRTGYTMLLSLLWHWIQNILQKYKDKEVETQIRRNTKN